MKKIEPTRSLDDAVKFVDELPLSEWGQHTGHAAIMNEQLRFSQNTLIGDQVVRTTISPYARGVHSLCNDPKDAPAKICIETEKEVLFNEESESPLINYACTRISEDAMQRDKKEWDYVVNRMVLEAGGDAFRFNEEERIYVPSRCVARLAQKYGIGAKFEIKTPYGTTRRVHMEKYYRTSRMGIICSGETQNFEIEMYLDIDGYKEFEPHKSCQGVYGIGSYTFWHNDTKSEQDNQNAAKKGQPKEKRIGLLKRLFGGGK